VGAPSGLVTLLFTDIEGSTRAWEAYPAEMQIALERHDEIVRAQIEDAGGYVFKTVGDAFCAAFAEPAYAIGAAVEVQEALAAEPWPEQVPIRVRVGLHSGVCQQRDGDYFGPAVNRVARLLGTAHGGQVVISGATAGLTAGDLAPGLSLLDLGEHRLKDLGDPERIYQVCSTKLPCDFPPLRSLDSPELMHNLPSQASTFVGREQVLDETRALLGQSRVLTLTGAGGVGKTRIALQLAADLLDGSGDGVWFVDFAPLSDPGLAAAKTAGVLGVREQPGRPVRESLVDALRSRRMLVVFDNCEHVIGEAATLVEALATGCPQVAILATSREPLRVSGERVYRVPSLSMPADADADALVRSEAVRLFLERATEQQPGFVLADEDAAVVGRLCRRLDGIPLAIELAAARLRSMALEDLDRRLDRRLRLLTGGSRAALPRQRTLEALIDWSYDLLNPPEQDLLARLSVFAGGFDLDAAEAVAAWGRGASMDVLDGLTALVDKSLVETDRSTAFRYRLLESVRQYGAAKLADRGQDVVRAGRAAHRDHYLAVAETAAPHLIGHGQLEWLDRLDLEIDNLRMALAFSLEDPDPTLSLRLSAALCYFWNYRKPMAEGATAICAALDRRDAQEPTVVRGNALTAAALLLTTVAGQHEEAAERAKSALAIAGAWTDSLLHAEALYALSVVHGQVGNADAHFAAATHGLQEARTLGNQHLTGQLLMTRATSEYLTQRERMRDCEECIAIFQTVGNRVMYVRALANLGYLELWVGRVEPARARFDEALRLARTLADPRGLSAHTCNLGFALYLSRAYAEARGLFEESLRIASSNSDLLMVAYAQLGLALLAALGGDAKAAARLHGNADALHEKLGTRLQPVESGLRDADIARLRADLGNAQFEAAYSGGRNAAAPA
jgi:predicted ATPase/class 3 adenylate cyclase